MGLCLRRSGAKDVPTRRFYFLAFRSVDASGSHPLIFEVERLVLRAENLPFERWQVPFLVSMEVLTQQFVGKYVKKHMSRRLSSLQEGHGGSVG
ncbi:hypothetical protein N665_0044s0027 [Sinapis alba]|nr:hypothetical protein N665_0044s0027 [Sinapis alba]